MMLDMLLMAIISVLAASHLRTNWKITHLEMMLDGVITFGPERWEKMIKNIHE